MKAIRDPGMLTGFYFQDPLPALACLTHVGEAICSGSHFVPPHQHRGFEFTYLIQGLLRVQVGRQTFYDIGPGEVVATCPRETHQWPRRRHSGYQHLWLGLDLDSLGGAGGLLAARIRGGARVVRGCHEVEPVIRGLVRQMFHPRPHVCEVTRAHLEVFVALLLQQMEVDGERTAHTGPYTPEVETVVGFLVENLSRRLTLDEMAQQSGHSRSWLCERFGREVGLPPQMYHLRLRLESAREALLQSEATISGVALTHGFRSSQHFSSAFSRAFGLSPRKWQQRTDGRAAPKESVPGA